jgi:hypothetical protein
MVTIVLIVGITVAVAVVIANISTLLLLYDIAPVVLLWLWFVAVA